MARWLWYCWCGWYKVMFGPRRGTCDNPDHTKETG
jgi:hypothetical protein